jgi:hypothetical protein
MSSFSIPDNKPKIELNKGSVDAVSGAALSPHSGAVQFAVNNGAGEIIDGKLSVLPDGQAKPEWFSIDGDAQRDFGTSGSETVKVNVSVPADVAQGDYSFRLQVAAVTDPDNEFAISPSTAFTVPAAEQKGGKKKSKWWLWLLLGLLALAIIGGVVYALTRPKPPPPVDPATEAPPTAEPTTAVVPDLIGKSVDEAKGLAANFEFKANPGQVTGAQPNTVLTQNPGKDLTRSKGDPLVVTFDPGVQVPPLVGSRLADATNAILGAKLVQGRITTHCIRTGMPNLVHDQNPNQGTPVPANTTVTLVITALPPTPFERCQSKVLSASEARNAAVLSKAVNSTTFNKAASGISPKVN